MSPPPRSLSLPGADGLSLHALDWSAGESPRGTLLLMHGFGHSARIWDDLVPLLPSGHRVLAVDQRGHGDSDRDPAAGYDHPGFASDLGPLTASLGAEPCAIVGHSMGAYASLHFADAHPERVRALVLIDAGAELTSPKISKFKARGLARDPSYASPEEYAETLERALAHATPERRLRLARAWLSAGDDGRFRLKLDPATLEPRKGLDPLGDRTQWAKDETARLWAILGRLACPVLVVRGAESRMLREDVARRMVEDVLRDGRFVEIPEAGHPVMADNPEALGAELSAFLASLDR